MRYLRVGRQPRLDPGTRRALNEMWNVYGEAILLAVFRECGAPSDVTAYVESLTPDWNAYVESHREELERVQRLGRQEADRILRRHLRGRVLRRHLDRAGNARRPARARRGRRATLRRSRARSSTGSREPDPPGRPSSGEAAA
jgi:hypothetical protein